MVPDVRGRGGARPPARLPALTGRRPRRARRAFYPSLHLNLASDHLKLGEPDLAREQLERAVRSLDALPEDAFSAGIRTAVDELRQRLR
ncbi:hypothetical protein [Kitasatospora sp. Ki12]